jgi:hypothetical protein
MASNSVDSLRIPPPHFPVTGPRQPFSQDTTSNPFSLPQASSNYFLSMIMQQYFYESMILFNALLMGKMSHSDQSKYFDTNFNTKTNIDTLQKSYNPTLGNKLANIAYKVATGKNTSGMCYRGVKDSLKTAGIDNGSVVGGSAYMAKNYLSQHKNFKEVSVSREELNKLPAGCVIVWQPYNDKKGKYHKHGHITVTLGDGREASDHVQKLVMAGNYNVFVPTGLNNKA